jgi:hypothetical protein
MSHNGFTIRQIFIFEGFNTGTGAILSASSFFFTSFSTYEEKRTLSSLQLFSQLSAGKPRKSWPLGEGFRFEFEPSLMTSNYSVVTSVSSKIIFKAL